MIDKPGIYTMDAATYHADPVIVPSLSSGIARILLSQSPRHAWTAHPRLNPDCIPESNSKFDLGSAAHALLLEGEDRMVQIDAPDYRTKAAQEERDAARTAGKHPILKAEYLNVLLMREAALKAIAECPDLSGMTLEDGTPEQTIIWQEGAGGQVWCRIRPDWLANDHSLIIDYKSTAASANPDAWVRTMTGMGGDVQGAFYTRGAEKALDIPSPKFVFLVQEVYPPFACSFIGLPPSFMELGMEKMRVAVAGWSKCMTADRWPAYTNRICWVEPPPYYQAAWEERGPDALGIPYDVAKLWEKIQ